MLFWGGFLTSSDVVFFISVDFDLFNFYWIYHYYYILFFQQSIPELTTGEKYVLGLIKSRLVSEPEDKDTHTALIYDRSEVLTFDGKLFQTKGWCHVKEYLITKA